MSLSDDLARVCCGMQKQADLPSMRNEFEQSALKEEALRENAQRFQELAAQRSAREDTSPSGYLATGASRLAPIPHTTGEAAIRLPAMVAGGIAGHHFGKRFEPLPAAHLEQIFKPGDKLKALGEQLSSLSHQNQTVEPLLTKLTTTPGREIADALREAHPPFMPRPGAGLRQEMVNLFTEGKMPQVRSAISRYFDLEKIPSASKAFGRAGAVGGALGAGAVAGLPFVIRALLQKRHGGEAAVRARGQSSEALSRAEQESQHREDILNKLPGNPA